MRFMWDRKGNIWSIAYAPYCKKGSKKSCNVSDHNLQKNEILLIILFFCPKSQKMLLLVSLYSVWLASFHNECEYPWWQRRWFEFIRSFAIISLPCLELWKLKADLNCLQFTNGVDTVYPGVPGARYWTEVLDTTHYLIIDPFQARFVLNRTPGTMVLSLVMAQTRSISQVFRSIRTVSSPKSAREQSDALITECRWLVRSTRSTHTSMSRPGHRMRSRYPLLFDALKNW